MLYQNTFNELIPIFGSKTKAQEMLLLLKDAKAVVRQGFYENELKLVEEFCRENSLYYTKSNFKVLLADATNNYSNEGIKVDRLHPKSGMFFIYISKDVQKSLLASHYENKGNDRDLGLLLGYPVCCVDFFCKRFSADNPNLQLKPSNPFTNLTKRDQDCVLISHFPCRSECEESIELAKKHLRIIWNTNKERADEMAAKLQQGL